MHRHPSRANTRLPLVSLASAGMLMTLAFALGAGGAGGVGESGQNARDDKRLEDKDYVIQRMLEIGERVGELRSTKPSRDSANALKQLMAEYTTLSKRLGGDDPAHLGVIDNSRPAHAADEGVIASAPAAPAGCTPSPFAFSNNTPANIVSGNPQNTLVTSQITVAGAGTFLWDLNVTTFIAHPNGIDLDITLTSPAGTIVTLTTDNGVGANNFNGTIWDDNANPLGQVPYATTAGIATDHPYSGSSVAATLVPEEAMGAFFGENPNGVWTLTISDDTFNSSNGALNSWSLGVTTASSAPTITTSTTSYTGLPLAISSAGTPTISAIINVSGAGSSIADVNTTTSITHTFCADIDMTLRSPAGTVVTLTTDNGGTFDNVFNGTLWDDDANPIGPLPQSSNNGVATDHVYADLTLATPLVPEEALAAFIGENPNGDWTLTINDDANVNGGSLEAWSLAIGTAGSTPALTTTNFTNVTPITGIDSTPPILAVSTITVSGAGAYLWDLDLATTIAHTASADLDVTLTSPAGTVVTLTSDNGGASDNNFNGTTWDDDANPLGALPYTSNTGLATDSTYTNLTTLTPLVVEEALGAFIGENPNGVWTLTINDDTPAVDIGALNAWSMNLTTLNQAPTGTLTTASNNAAMTISASGTPVITSTITVAGAPTFLSDVNVVTGITHAFSGDIDMTLTSPAGTIVTLTTDNGAGNDNVFNGTVWNDSANPGGPVPQTANNGVVSDHTFADLTTASPLVPEEALAAFIGENPNGDWTLTINDDTAGSGGALNSWSLQLTTAVCSGSSCPADINGDNQVNVSDLLSVITNWGVCPGLCPPSCPADIAPAGVGDCNVNVSDLLFVITSWGACP